MRLDKNSWHARLYRWTLWQSWRFWLKPGKSRLLTQTTLCHYIRVLLLCLPITVVSHLLLLYWAVYVLVWWPIETLGWQSYGESIGILDGTAILVTAATGGILYLSRNRFFVRRPLRRHFHLPNPYPGFFALLGQWLRDRHEHICSVVELDP